MTLAEWISKELTAGTSSVAGRCAAALGLANHQNGGVISVPERGTVEIIEACGGFVAFSWCIATIVLFASYWLVLHRRRPKADHIRTLVLASLSTFLIAIVCNVGRIMWIIHQLHEHGLSPELTKARGVNNYATGACIVLTLSSFSFWHCVTKSPGGDGWRWESPMNTLWDWWDTRSWLRGCFGVPFVAAMVTGAVAWSQPQPFSPVAERTPGQVALQNMRSVRALRDTALLAFAPGPVQSAAQEDLNRFLSRGQVEWRDHFVIGTAALQVQNYSEAHVHLTLALKRQPTEPRTLNNLAMLAVIDNGDLDLALERSQAAVEQHPESVPLLDTLARVRTAREEDELSQRVRDRIRSIQMVIRRP